MDLLRQRLCEGGQQPGKVKCPDPDALRGPGLPGHEVHVVFDFVDPRGLVRIAEVEEGDQLLSAVVAADAEDVVVVGLHDPDVRLSLEDRIAPSDLLELQDRLVEAALPRRGIVALCHVVPVEITSVEIAAVVIAERVVMIAVVIQLADLVAAVDDRDAALRKEKCVQHDVQPDRPVQLGGILLVHGGLDAAQRGRRASKSRVAERRIVVIEFAAGVGALPFSSKKIVQIFLVRNLLHAESAQEIVVESPADVVVAAQVIEEGVFLREREDGLQLVAEKAHVPRGDGVPGAGHRRDVVEHVALGFLDRAEIRDHLGRLHHDLAEQHRAGADDLRGHAHEADERVDLRQVPAGRAEGLPDIGHCVKTDDVHAVIAQVEHVRGHVVEHDGVRVIEVPLIRVKCRHHDLSGLFAPGEIAGRGGGEHLRDGALELVRDLPVVEEEIAVLVLQLALSRSYRPLVVLARVVHDEVEADADSSLVALK